MQIESYYVIKIGKYYKSCQNSLTTNIACCERYSNIGIIENKAKDVNGVVLKITVTSEEVSCLQK